MNTFLKGLIGGIVAASLIFLGYAIYKTGHKNVGGTSLTCPTSTCLNDLEITTNGLQVDAGGVTITAGGLGVTSGGITTDSITINGGTALTKTFTGSCTLRADASIAATSTGTGTCAISGLLAGDKVFVELATTTTNLNSQYVIAGAVAGTNSATIRLINLTGTAAVPGATSGFGSSTSYWVTR